MELPTLLSIARGDAPADTVLAGGRILNVFNGQIEQADIAIAGGRIVGVGAGYSGREVINLAGAYVAPGLIDAHVHIESSLCTPPEFARAVVPRGVTTVVTDPHEIANVAGRDGIVWMAEKSRGLPLQIKIMAPSCVPATSMATTGAALLPDDMRWLADKYPSTVIGLAEVMNFPGVIAGDARMLDRIAAFAGRPIDGHCPGVRGSRLNAYVAAGVGSDHECVTVEEASEKLARGLYILIREATNARNLEALLPLITPATSRRICLCTDDRQPADLLGPGGIDHMLRVTIASGIAPVDALRLCTLNPSEWFGLRDRGAIAPGRRADLFVFDDLAAPRARLVFNDGNLVARDGAMIPSAAPRPMLVTRLSARCDVRWEALSLDIPATACRVRVIGSVEGQLVTDCRTAQLQPVGGRLQADPSRDVLKMAVIERHRGTGNVGLGFVQGFGLKRGAIAGTVAHDHHNLVVIGADDESMHTAARAAAKAGGGLAVASGSQTLATLPLPVGGLMSEAPIDKVRDGYAALLSAAKELGSAMHDPMMAMSFMALEVIPSLKLTDQGLVDVDRFERVSLYA